MKLTWLLNPILFWFLGDDGNPFSIMGSMYPTNDEGKYVIEAEGIRLAFVKRGGALANLWINDTNCREIDVVLGFDNITQYDTYEGVPALNGVIGMLPASDEVVAPFERQSEAGIAVDKSQGRYAGTISGGSFEMDGVRYETSKNHPDQKSTLHGGERGWGQVLLHPAAMTKNSITFVAFDRGNNGFPGRAASSLTHTVTPYEWRITYGVTPLVSKSPISLSQQVFWNLGGFDASSGSSISEHLLHLPLSGLRLETDSNNIPSGDIKGNKLNSSLDFWSRPRSVDTVLDDTFLVTRGQPWSMLTTPAATLLSPASGIKLDLYTDQAALHAVTWEAQNVSLKLKKTQGQGLVPPHSAISLQMQDWTDAVNHPEWQRDEYIFWGTDKLYTMHTVYKFSATRSLKQCT